MRQAVVRPLGAAAELEKSPSLPLSPRRPLHAHPSDDELIARLQRGDTTALDSLLSKYWTLVVDYIERLLKCIVNQLGLPWNVIRSSTLDLPPTLRGQHRILEIARQLGARRYVNAPGGRSLYDPVDFNNAGIDLCFLPEYHGPNVSILERMVDGDHEKLAGDIRAIPDGPRVVHGE